jgi:hypothetical protein
MLQGPVLLSLAIAARPLGRPGGGVGGTGFYLAPLNKDKVVPVELSVEQDVLSDAS